MTREELIGNFPGSVVQWLGDKDVAAAVNHIAAIKNDGLPEGLELGEYDDFLSARAGAHLVRAEFPRALWTAWQVVWGQEIPERFSPMGIDKAYIIKPLDCWEYEEVAIAHVVHDSEGLGVRLDTAFGMNADETWISFALTSKGKPLIDHLKPFKWDSDWEFLVATWKECLTSDGFPWHELLAARDAALKAVEEHVWKGNKLAR